MDHVRLDPARFKPARQPKAVAAGFESKRNPRDRAAGPDRLIPPAVQHRKQPFRARVQLLARLTLNTRNDAANQPARLAQLDDGNLAGRRLQLRPPPAWLAGKAFQYRSEADVVARLPRRSQRSRAVLSVRWIFESGLGSTKAEHDPLIVPDKRQAGVLEELFCRQVGRLPPSRIAWVISGAR
jgi:hypothetical protein